jgi:hypothetical protein
MTRATPIADEQLFELLRDADPLAADIGPSSAVEGDRLLQRILSSERVSTPRPDWQRARRRRRLVVSAASGGGVTAAVVAAVLVFTAGKAPSVAFAGWRADPTAAASGQAQVAEAECRRNSALASLKPTLVDTRGPYTLLVYAESSGSLCVTGPHLQSPTGEPPVARLGVFLAASSAAGRSAAQRRGLPYPNHPNPLNTTSVAPDAIRRIDNASVIATTTVPQATLTFNDGRIGAYVTAVTIELADGSRVRATTSHGWFAAWWPGSVEAQSAEITTASGTTTQQLKPAPGYETATSTGSTGH